MATKEIEDLYKEYTTETLKHCCYVNLTILQFENVCVFINKKNEAKQIALEIEKLKAKEDKKKKTLFKVT